MYLAGIAAAGNRHLLCSRLQPKTQVSRRGQGARRIVRNEVTVTRAPLWVQSIGGVYNTSSAAPL